MGDEAFFRRIHNKIFVGCVDDESFDWILSRVATKRGLECDAVAASRLREVAKQRGDGELRAYLPGVVCELATAIVRYENMGPTLTPTLIDRVLDLYFTRPEDGAKMPAPRTQAVAAADALAGDALSQEAAELAAEYAG